MKLAQTVIVFFISLSIYAQEFKPTANFSITNINLEVNATKIDESKNLQLYLYQEDQPISKLININKDDLDFFVDASVYVLKKPQLNNVKQIIKVEFEFLACCTNYESLYFIQTNSNKIIALPQLDYTFCEYATDKLEYIFPSQKFGQANHILTTESYLDQNQKTETIQIINTQIWQNNDFVAYNYKK